MIKLFFLFVAVTFFGFSLRPSPKISAHRDSDGGYHVCVRCPKGFVEKVDWPVSVDGESMNDSWVRTVNAAGSARCVVDWKGNAHEK